MSYLKTLWKYFQHGKYYREHLKSTVGLLTAYAEDLRYASTDGVYGCNFRTSGTPEFDSEEEMMEYIQEVNETIKDIEELL